MLQAQSMLTPVLERCVRVSLTGLLVLMMVTVAMQRGTFVVDALLTLSPPSSNDARWTIASADNPSGAAEELHTLRVAVSSRVVISYDAALSTATNGHVLAKVGSEDVDDGDFSLGSGLSVTSEASGEIQLSGGYGDDIQVVLTRPYQLQSLLTTGTGDVVVLDQVFANAKVSVGDAAINIDVSGSGGVFVHTSETLTAKNVSWTIRGYGDLQVEAQAFNFDSLEVNAKGLGSNLNVFANSEQQQSLTSSSIGSASFVGTGMGEMCLDTPNIEIANIKVWLSGAGTLSFSQPGGTCATEELVVTGSGNIHLGALRCSNVKVQMSGSGDATVQATDYLGGSISGSGSVKYIGAQPPRTMSDKNGRVTTGISLGQPSNDIAKPAHQTPTVSCRRSSVPTLKANHVGGTSIPVPLVPSDQMMDKPVSTPPASVDVALSIDWTAISRFISTHAHSIWEFIKENRYVGGVVAAFAVMWITLLLVVRLQQRRRKSKRRRRRRRGGERRPLLQHDDEDEDTVYI